MNVEFRNSPMENFDFSVLNDPEYGEDSVREDIITPIIRALGYSANGNNKIIRSRKLLHPFVSIGSISRKINIIPDYIMELSKRPAWILEAKAPTEDLLNTKHAEQAYSYAIHSEVRAKYYALCNGREFILYDVGIYEPILKFEMKNIDNYWNEINKLLNPIYFQFKKEVNLQKDYGLHLKKLGVGKDHKLFYLEFPFPFIARIENNLYTTSVCLNESDLYQVSLDFSYDVFLKMKKYIPSKVYKYFEEEPEGIVEVHFEGQPCNIPIECRLGDDLIEIEKEIFNPLIVKNVL